MARRLMTKHEGLTTPNPEPRPTTEPSDTRMTLTVSYPEHTISAVQYNSFRIGGLTLTVEVLPGQTVQQAAREAFDELRNIAAAQFQDLLVEHLDFVRQAQRAARGQ